MITKDTDFYHSHLLHGKPFKLVLLRTGNLGKRDLMLLFARHLDEVLVLLEDNTLVEIDHTTAKAVRERVVINSLLLAGVFRGCS